MLTNREPSVPSEERCHRVPGALKDVPVLGRLLAIGLVDLRRLLPGGRRRRKDGVRLLTRLHEVVLLARQTLDLGVALEILRLLLEVLVLLAEDGELLLGMRDRRALRQI